MQQGDQQGQSVFTNIVQAACNFGSPKYAQAGQNSANNSPDNSPSQLQDTANPPDQSDQQQDDITLDSRGDPVRGPNESRIPPFMQQGYALMQRGNTGQTVSTPSGTFVLPQEITFPDGNQEGYHNTSLPNQGAVEETKDFQQAGNN